MADAPADGVKVRRSIVEMEDDDAGRGGEGGSYDEVKSGDQLGRGDHARKG